MKISYKHQATQKENNAECLVTEHPIHDEMIDIAIAEISGRYPNTRLAVNQQCKELAYVYEGAGKIIVNDQEYILNAGDVVLIEAGEKFYWEGNIKIFISCRPAWTKDQHLIVD